MVNSCCCYCSRCLYGSCYWVAALHCRRMFRLYVNKSLIRDGQHALLLYDLAETPAVACIAVTVKCTKCRQYLHF